LAPTDTTFRATGNPIIKHTYTADPATIVHQDKVYLYTGHDAAPPRREGYVMQERLVFSSHDMVTWTEHPVPLKVTDFSWTKADAWASHVVERNGKFYWYATVGHGSIPGFSVGVAVAESATGPFKDARGSALITNNITTDIKIGWDDIDPAVFIAANGQTYIFWGNTTCH
jgi:beta-xylosidase